MVRLGVWAVVVGVGVGVAAWWRAWNTEPPLPPLDPNPWWGPGRPGHTQDTAIKPFTINISQEALDDLNTRLALPPRLTPGLQDSASTYGINADTVSAVVDHWRHNYHWRQREARLNSYPHFKTKIEGLDIHFLRASAEKGRASVPLLLIHGWPGSIVEFYDLLPLLTHPPEGSVALEVICPSIPGYGFSEGPVKQGFGHVETAQVMLKLMKRLGYERFYVQGGDWGAMIVTNMATMYPQNVLGVHLNMAAVNTGGVNLKMLAGAVLPAGLVVSQEDQDKLYPLGQRFATIMREMGYAHIQATKPDTIGAAVNQNPISLAVYIMEKFSSWTSMSNINLPDAGLLSKDFPISLDAILDNICIYWFTNSITTSMRYYAENMNIRSLTHNVDSIPCRVPAGLAVFPHELLNHPKNFAAHKFYDIVSYNEQPAGGHFAAMERPQLVAKDVLQFINTVEQRRGKKQ